MYARHEHYHISVTRSPSLSAWWAEASPSLPPLKDPLDLLLSNRDAVLPMADQLLRDILFL